MSGTWRMPFSEGCTVRVGANPSRDPLPAAWVRRRWLMRSLTEVGLVSGWLLPCLEGEDEVANAGCAELAGLLNVVL